MKNIINLKNKEEIIHRIVNLKPFVTPIWGKMNANEMLCHIADSIKMALGVKQTEFVGNRISSSILKRLVLLGMPAPKGKVETAKELKQGVGGTAPIEFDQDKQTLIKLINDFNNLYKDEAIIKHPAFGNMNKKQWSRLTYIHVDHHLKQFGA